MTVDLLGNVHAVSTVKGEVVTIPAARRRHSAR